MTHPGTFGVQPPTEVVGRRIGAYLIDSLIGFVIFLVVVLSMLHRTTVGGDVENCGAKLRNDTEICFQVPDSNDAYYVDKGDAWKQFVASAGWFLLADVILQGWLGGTPGKLIVGIRAVRPDGQICGLWRAFVRSLPFAVGVVTGGVGLGVGAQSPVITAVGWLGTLLLVGELVVLLVRKDHRRVGDLLAGTVVVRKEWVGHEIPIPSGRAVVGAPGWTGQPGWKGGQGWTGGPGWGQSTAQQLPRWDQARDTYIWWDDEQGEWLEHDRSSGEWRPISR